MTSEKMNEKGFLKVVNAAVDKYGKSRAELIPILNDINRSIGYLPKEALGEISRQLQVPRSTVFTVSTFYRMLSTKPRGRHVILFCESAPCHVVGGREVFLRLQEELKIGPEENTLDGKWSLVTVSCLGACGVGPVIVIDDDIYGNVTPSQIPEILGHYK
jgi:NADH-quinone oxidoreductase subunit E